MLQLITQTPCSPSPLSHTFFFSVWTDGMLSLGPTNTNGSPCGGKPACWWAAFGGMQWYGPWQVCISGILRQGLLIKWFKRTPRYTASGSFCFFLISWWIFLLSTIAENTHVCQSSKKSIRDFYRYQAILSDDWQRCIVPIGIRDLGYSNEIGLAS